MMNAKPEPRPCINPARGNSEGVSEIARKYRPVSKPTAEKVNSKIRGGRWAGAAGSLSRSYARSISRDGTGSGSFAHQGLGHAVRAATSAAQLGARNLQHLYTRLA